MADDVDDSEVEVKEQKSVEAPDTMAFVLSVYHTANDDSDPTGVQVRTSRILAGHEQCFERKLKVPVGTMFCIYDRCWIENPSYVLIQNKSVASVGVQPTPQQKKDLEDNRILVKIGGRKFASLRVNGVCFIEVDSIEDLQDMTIESTVIEGKVTLNIYPG